MPPLTRLALLLDLDGTLLELAPAPSEELIPHGLPALLRRPAPRFGGASALISGRPIEEADALFPGLGIAIVGEMARPFAAPPKKFLDRRTHTLR